MFLCHYFSASIKYFCKIFVKQKTASVLILPIIKVCVSVCVEIDKGWSEKAFCNIFTILSSL